MATQYKQQRVCGVIALHSPHKRRNEETPVGAVQDVCVCCSSIRDLDGYGAGDRNHELMAFEVSMLPAARPAGSSRYEKEALDFEGDV